MNRSSIHLQQLARDLCAEKQRQHPTIPAASLPTVKCRENSLPTLTRCMYNRLRLDGHPVTWLRKPAATNSPLPHLQAFLNGRWHYLLAVPGNLVQTDAQYRYQRDVEHNGHGYIVCKDYDDFILCYETILEPKPCHSL